jgi:hypothetical protein
VAIYCCMPNQLRADGTGRPAAVTELASAVARSHAAEPFAMLGVTTVGMGRASDQESFKTSLRASGLPARFWWDISADGKPGPIQTAWNARVDLYVLDYRGLLRYKHVLGPTLLEKAVATLLKEQKDEQIGPKRNE